MLRIRLRRVGKKKQPSYRIVVADSHSPRDGRYVEVIGHYHPLDNPSTIVLDADRARFWLDRGARPSLRVSKILAIESVAELPAEVKARIALGEERAKEAKQAKADEPKAEAAEAADEPKAEAADKPKAEATDKPKAEAADKPKAEAAEKPKAEAAEEPKAEAADKPKAEAAEEPKAKAADEPKAEAAEEEKAGA